MMEDLQSLLCAHDAAGSYFDALEAKIVAPVVSAVVLDATSESDVSTTLEAELSGTFRFEHELAGGGMSRVFVAEDVRLKRRVVIKVVPPDMAPIADPEH